MDQSEVRRTPLEHFVNFEEIKNAGLNVSEELEAAGRTKFFSLREEIYHHPLKEFWRSAHVMDIEDLW